MSGRGAGAASTTVETILVADADVLVRLVIADYLRDCGYRVIEAANTEEARAVLVLDSTPVSVVLVGLEGTNPGEGFALAQWIRRRRPELQVLLAGTPVKAAETAGELCAEASPLARPYDAQVVLDRIRRLLARRRRPRPE